VSGVSPSEVWIKETRSMASIVRVVVMLRASIWLVSWPCSL
jgi:hypothetical protein